jgi:hypothetical protein
LKPMISCASRLLKFASSYTGRLPQSNIFHQNEGTITVSGDRPFVLSDLHISPCFW